MRLLTGPAGSGKTTFVLDRFRDAVRARNQDVRLLVPTATLAQHLRNRIAREGFVFRGESIQTLSEFVAPWAGDPPEVPEPVLYLIVEEAARRIARPEFARVVHMPGFCATLARTIAEFSSAGCDSGRLAGCLPDAPLAAAFLEIYREVDRLLAQRGFAMRATRLARAAERIGNNGLAGLRTVWLDGFHALPDPELGVIGAMGRHAELTLTFEAMDPRLRALGFREERLARSRATPVMGLVRAPGIEREAEEIARRILEQAAAGRPFREIGIIVRAQETYAPILRSTLERFGIPARFYFDEDLEQHAAVRFLAGAVDAMLGGWDHAATLAGPAPGAAIRRFDASWTSSILPCASTSPMPGWAHLKALRTGGRREPAPAHRRLGAIEEWRSFALAPRDWAARLRTLRNLFRPACIGARRLPGCLRSGAARPPRSDFSTRPWTKPPWRSIGRGYWVWPSSGGP